MHGFDGMGWGMGFGWILGLLLLIAIVWILVKVFNSGNYPPQTKEKSALDILKERYARGEISKEEFEERKKTIID